MEDYSLKNSDISFKADNIRHNILSLRQKLLLTQKEFIELFLDAGISLSKYSNFENKGGKDAVLMAKKVSEGIFKEPDIFYLEPDIFAKNLDLFLNEYFQKERKENSSNFKKSSPLEGLVQAISDYLIDGLLSGELSAGKKIPSDRSFSAMFKTPRTAVREALKVLSILGFIEIHPGYGTFISANSSRFLAAPLTWTFFLGEQDIGQIISVRNVLEIESAALAAKNLSEQSKKELSAIFEDSNKAYCEGNFQDFLNLDMDFHLAIAKCSQNIVIYNLLNTSRKLITKISESGMENLSQLKNIFQEHRFIYQAIIGENPAEAALKMTEHLNNSVLRYEIKNSKNPA